MGLKSSLLKNKGGPHRSKEPPDKPEEYTKTLAVFNFHNKWPAKGGQATQASETKK